MERSFDIETVLEESFLNLLSGHATTSGYNMKLWDDNSEAYLTPYINIKANLTEEEGGLYNSYRASNVIVDFAVFSSRTDDEDGKEASEVRGDIRNLIGQTDIVSLLNQTSGLNVYNNGIIPQLSVDNSDGKLFQKGLSIMVVCTTIDY